MAKKLKPCPFCGSEAKFSPSLDDKTHGLIECTNKNCYARVDWYDVASRTTLDFEKAIEAWNRRVSNET